MNDKEREREIVEEAYTQIKEDDELITITHEGLIATIAYHLRALRAEALEDYKRDNLLLNEIRNEQFKLGFNHGLEEAAKIAENATCESCCIENGGNWNFVLSNGGIDYEDIAAAIRARGKE